MWRSVRSAIARAILVATGSANAVAQAPAPIDRLVGLDFFGKPLVVKTLTASGIGALGAAAGVPMGFEAAVLGGSPPLNIEASGKPLRAVLDQVVAADGRYEWRDEEGVAVLRPAAAWTDRNNPLHRSVAAIRFDDVGACDALQIMLALFGQDLHPSQRNNLRDTKRFNLDVPAGSVLEALNAVVRSHGALAWGVEPWPPSPTAPGMELSPFMTSLVNGRAGVSIGIGVHLDREPKVPEQIDRWGGPEPVPGGPALDRVVGRRASGDPLILRGAHDLPELARAARAAMGIELLPPGDRRGGSDGVNVTGLSLREALTALIAFDPRFEWRELDGVVVVRPVAAWTQPDHPLARETGPVRLEQATVVDAVSQLHALVEPRMRFTPEPDRGLAPPRITVSAGRAPLLSQLNAIARSFGELCWIYEELNDRETQFFGGRSHQIGLQLPSGEGQGFAFR
jgi:hypothetical protein